MTKTTFGKGVRNTVFAPLILFLLATTCAHAQQGYVWDAQASTTPGGLMEGFVGYQSALIPGMCFASPIDSVTYNYPVNPGGTVTATTHESLTSDGQNLALQAYSTTVSPPDLGPASAGSDLLYVDTLNIETGGELYVTLALDGSVYMDPLNFQNGTLVTLPDIVLLQSLYSTYTTGCVPEFSVQVPSGPTLCLVGSNDSGAQSTSGTSPVNLNITFPFAFVTAGETLTFAHQLQLRNVNGLGTVTIDASDTPFMAFITISSPDGATFTSDSGLTYAAAPVQAAPAISVVKSASIGSFSAPGTLVNYSYTVTNSGNVTLYQVGVSDPMTGLSAVSCPNGTLAAAASEICTASYTTTQADVDAGSISNTGTATGTPPCGTPVMASSALTIPAVDTPNIGVVKSASITSFSAPGTSVTYRYQVTNAGNVDLNPVTVKDPMVGLSAISCPSTALAPGASETCSATYTTTQADVDAGSISNTGTASGTPPSGSAVTASSMLTILAVDTPSIGVIKSASITSYSAAGTPVTYSYQVTNTGNVDLNPVTVKDPMVGLSAISCPVTAFAPGASEICSATYTTTQADVSAGSIKNTGTATGAPKTGANATATSTLTIPYQASLTLSVSVTPNSLPFGTVSQYSAELETVTVKNTGSAAVSITGVSVTPADLYEFVPVSLCPRSLGVGKSCLIAIVLLADDPGAQSATLSIADSAAGSPQMVPMSATVIKRTGH